MSDWNDPRMIQAVLDDLETGVYLVDQSRRVRYWNHGAEKLTGYLRQDVIGRFLRDHLLAADGDASEFETNVDDPLNPAFRDGKSSTVNASILHKDGYRVPFDPSKPAFP